MNSRGGCCIVVVGAFMGLAMGEGLGFPGFGMMVFAMILSVVLASLLEFIAQNQALSLAFMVIFAVVGGIIGWNLEKNIVHALIGVMGLGFLSAMILAAHDTEF